MAKFGFDVKEVDPNVAVGFDPIPAGEYTLKALEAEEKQTANKDGSYIKVKFEVVKGEYAGRWIWQNFNINNPSQKAEMIGRQQLVAWATACGRPEADDTDKLIEKMFNAEVEIEKGKDGYADSNKIKAFLFSSDDKKSSKSVENKPASKNPWD